MSKSNIGLALVWLAVAGLSFFAGTRIFSSPLPPMTVKALVTNLQQCSPPGKSDACKTAAADVIEKLDQVAHGDFDIYETSDFEVFALGGTVLLRRTACKPEDLQVDEFHYRIWPTISSELPEGWKDSGFLGGVHKFSEAGLRSGRGCLLVVNTPLTHIKGLEIGQFDRAQSKWKWRVETQNH